MKMLGESELQRAAQQLLFISPVQESPLIKSRLHWSRSEWKWMKGKR